MLRPEGKPPKRKKWKWLKRLLIAGALVFAAACASPFLFTTAIARYAIARSAYRDVPLQFSSATLSPAGALTFRDVVIADTQESAGKALLRAESVRVDFGWRDILSGHVRMIAAEGAEVTLRPGKDTPLTLIRLFGRDVPQPAGNTATPSRPPLAGAPPLNQQPVAPTAPAPAPIADSGATTNPALTAPSPSPVTASSPPRAEGGFQLDQLLIVGRVRLEGFDAWTGALSLRNNEAIAFQLAMTTRAGPTYTVSLTAGEPDSATRPGLKARLAIRNTTAGTVIAAEQLTLQNLQPLVPESLLAQVSALPAEFRSLPPGRLEQLVLSGSATISKETSVNLVVDARNFSQRLVRPNATPAASIENLNASTRIAGKLSDNPLRDLMFTNTHFSWDVAQAGDYRFERGVADLEVVGPEIVLKDLQTTLFDTPLALSGAWDTHARVLSRGRIWFNNFSAPLLLSRLPQSIRQTIPGAIDGTFSARVFLSESDSEHIAAHVELACDERLRYFINNAPQSTAATQPIHPEAVPDLSFIKSELSGTVSWNYHLDSLPEISHGRFTADAMTIASPNPDLGLEVSAIKSDFTLGSGILRVIDCYADLAGEGQFSATGTYALSSGSVEQASISIEDGEASMFDSWSPGLLRGKFTATVEGKGTPAKAEASLSLELSPEVAFDIKSRMPASLAIAGTGAPALALKVFYDGDASTVRLEDATLKDAGTLHADAGFIAWLARRVAGEDAEMRQVFEAAKKGMALSPGEISLSGNIGWGPTGQIAGTIHLAGMDAQLQSDTLPAISLAKLAVKGNFALPWAIHTPEQVRVDQADLRAATLRIGDRELTDLSLQGTTRDGRTTLSSIAATFHEGKLLGDAFFATQGTESLHLGFQGLNQRLLTRSLYPDVFTAEGSISGSLTLSRKDGAPFTGEIHLTASEPGRLLISREASGSTIAPVAKAAVDNQVGAILPDDFDKIVSDQLADFPYEYGRVVLQDGENHLLQVTLFYDRIPLKPGDPGYAVPVTVAGQKVLANLEFNLRGTTLTYNKSITDILSDLANFQQSLARPNR